MTNTISTNPYLFKYIIVGDSCVGKSSILGRYTEDRYDDQNTGATIGVEFGTKIVNINDKYIKLQIWDTAGQERFRSIIRMYYRGSIGILLCYDSTNRESFNSIKNWICEIQNLIITKNKIILVATKTDDIINNQISKHEGAQLAEENGFLFIETSAKTGKNIEKCFTDLTREIVQFLDISDLQTMVMTIPIYSDNNQPKQSYTSCCY